MTGLEYGSEYSVVQQKLDNAPISSVHRKINMLIAGGMFIDGINLYMLSPILALFVVSGFSNVNHNANILFCNFLGLAIGSIVSGVVADRLGRQKMYQINLFVFGFASIIAALMPNVVWFTVFRFIIGLALGGEIITGYSTLAEFVPPRRRGVNNNLLNAVVSIGQPVSAFVGLALLPTVGWRSMFIVVGILGLVMWALRKTLPESPRWLEKNGYITLATTIADGISNGESLRSIREKVKGIGRDTEGTHSSAVKKKLGFAQLFSGKLIKRTIIAILLQCVQLCVVFGFTSWVPTMFVSAHFTLAHSLYYTAVMGLGLPIGGLVGVFWSDSLGRKAVMVGSGILGCAFGVLYGITLIHGGSPVVILLLGFLTEVTIMAFGGVSISTYLPELFPTEVRVTGTGLAVAIGRVASAVFPYAVVAVLHHYGVEWVFGMIAFVLAIGVVTALFGEETNKRSLEELDREVLSI
ncbi:MFS transporter [Alicyclobacillus cycloheptanicus]|uniref:MFS transporter n=1 Tax=Alicyclobacillus cycloheptanicus TaxID=1457 RepID=A0ABT9XJG6_9BACL|nr:MFS transporter [Alicyclobacillus cycloheptanicus]MDQ0190451.1 putative MFS transporter [Alicyclobacillus cycloheptanicus]WDM02690.1 MFS transporter [Alicyclobacillus cycloheptanicus]